ncbi:hypothetical protein OG897_06125 [Streptomyces sp. NBC_00237]|uniref:hypothetical protein n=1 Tax=Streptomyces sp. NBC_00237 TaxID=2975687 RepID=UPI002250B7FE|nr:hypothetical protein [Streptomyces sp. NBC_00237]MCX5201038.1 hypothetical protein [Streptomyces sp. NBC_00237]
MTFTPRTWAVGETVTASMLNTEIRDQFNSMFGAWTPYTPTWTAVTTPPALGNGTLTGQYMKIGRTCFTIFVLTMGSTTTYGSGFWKMSLPFTAATVTGGSPGVFNYIYSRSPTPNFMIGSGAVPNGASNTDLMYLPSLSVTGDWNALNDTTPVTPAAGEILRGFGTYQTAT